VSSLSFHLTEAESKTIQDLIKTLSAFEDNKQELHRLVCSRVQPVCQQIHTFLQEMLPMFEHSSSLQQVKDVDVLTK